MVDAVKEDEIREILNNTLPTIEGGQNQSVSVGMGESALLVIKVHDENEDTITANLERSDFDLFKLTNDYPGLYNLSFSGIGIPGTWKAQIVYVQKHSKENMHLGR